MIKPKPDQADNFSTQPLANLPLDCHRFVFPLALPLDTWHTKPSDSHPPVVTAEAQYHPRGKTPSQRSDAGRHPPTHRYTLGPYAPPDASRVAGSAKRLRQLRDPDANRRNRLDRQHARILLPVMCSQSPRAKVQVAQMTDAAQIRKRLAAILAIADAMCSETVHPDETRRPQKREPVCPRAQVSCSKSRATASRWSSPVKRGSFPTRPHRG